MRRFSLALVLAALALTGTRAQAAIIVVPTDQPTIQAGVIAAVANDTVLVEDGTYFENVVVRSKQIVLASRYLLDGDPAHIAATVIDGSTPSDPDTGSCVILHNALNSQLVGFTLTGGTGTAWFDPSDSFTYREGGGVLTDGGSPVIRNNAIIRNEATDFAGLRSAGGGGIRSGFGTSTIENNIIAYNKARYGAGVVAFHNPVVIRNNLVFRNSGGEDFGGGGLWITSAGGACTVNNNTILENVSAVDGGGVLVWAATVAMRNNVIRGNEAPNGPQFRQRSGASGAVAYNNIEGGWNGTGMIDVDPVFATTNFHLDPSSPCVDTGDPNGVYNDKPDPGNLGQALWPSLGAVRNDMGAYGGPYAVDLPAFNDVALTPTSGSIDFDSVDVTTTATLSLDLVKQGFGIVRVDSVRFYGASAADLACPTALPFEIGPALDDSLGALHIAWTPDIYGLLDDTVLVFHNSTTAPSPILVTLHGTAPGADGDANLDGAITSADIIYLVNFVFKGGPPPLPISRSGDANCDGPVTSSDVIYLVNYVFKGGPPPNCA